jgi:5-methyltetrahydrofolate--homocysteine methyltransferase
MAKAGMEKWIDPNKETNVDKKLSVIFEAVLKGDSETVTTTVQDALDGEISAESILKQGLIPAMAEVGNLFEQGEYFVPEMLVSAHAMKAGLGILRPLLVAEDIKPIGKVIIGSVQGDLHDIGKNLVGMMLEGAGFEIVDLGVNVKPEQYIEAAKIENALIIAMSALLTTTVPAMQATIKALEEAGLRDRFKVIIGGAPVTAEYAEEIGADGYAPDASQATALAKSFL